MKTTTLRRPGGCVPLTCTCTTVRVPRVDGVRAGSAVQVSLWDRKTPLEAVANTILLKGSENG